MITPPDERHGKVAGYSAGCHQACCRAAMVRYEKVRLHEAHLGRPRTIDATGSARRIHALQAIGWSVPAIAKAAGMHVRTLQRVTKHTRVLPTTAAKITRIYDQLSMTKPLTSATEDKISVSHTIRNARQVGYLPPLAWDDDRIDDPAYDPTAELEVPDALDDDTVLISDIEEMVRSRRGIAEISLRIGKNPQNAARWLARHGRDDLACLFERKYEAA